MTAAVSPRWEDPRTVAGFVSSPPNAVLLDFAARRLTRAGAWCLDLGCGAARNALPLAELGYRVVGTDLAMPMLEAARQRVREAGSTPGAVSLVRASMAPLPLADAQFDLVVAHGIWNLARSGLEFRAALAEAARVARPDAGLFLFTFSRHTLPSHAAPDPGESFVFSSWNGEPQCFLSEAEIFEELGRVGFVVDPPGPLTEYNRRRPGELPAGGPPVIYEGTFQKGV
jgi:SAM-dependent methyltransferase